MKKYAFILLLMAALALTSGQSLAAEYQLDPVHSSIGFKIRHVLGQVVGLFQEYDGKIVFNPQELDKAKLEVTIKVASLNTFVPKRDQHLLSPDFFAAEAYPLISFVSQKIEHVSGDLYQASGKLKIKQVEKDISVQLRYLGKKQNPMDDKQTLSAIAGNFKIDRLDYKVGDGKFWTMGMVGKEVDIWFDFEMIQIK